MSSSEPKKHPGPAARHASLYLSDGSGDVHRRRDVSNSEYHDCDPDQNRRRGGQLLTGGFPFCRGFKRVPPELSALAQAGKSTVIVELSA